MVHFCESLRANSAASTSPCSQSPTMKSYLESCPCPQTPNGAAYGANVGAAGNGYGVGGVTQFSRSNATPATTNAQTRHVISPLVCEGAVPTLQSPKNTVAPSDVIIERQPSPQTLMASTTPTDYSGNIQRVKTSLVEQNQNRSPTGLNLNLGAGNEQNANNIDLKPVVMKRVDIEGNNKLHQLMNGSSNEANAGAENNNLIPTNHNIVSPIKGTANNNSINVCKRKERTSSSKSSPSGNQIGIAGAKWCVNKQEEIQFIDEDSLGESADKSNAKQTSSAMVMGQHPPVCLADSMVRSCSVGYLDLVDAQLVPCEVALMMLRKETPKRLVLVNQKKQKKHKSKSQQNHENSDKSSNNSSSQPPKLKHCGKSKSLDSTDIFTPREHATEKNPPSDSSMPHANMNSIDDNAKAQIPATSSAQNNTQNTNSKSSVSQTVPSNIVSINEAKNMLNQKCSINEIESIVEKSAIESNTKNTSRFVYRDEIVKDTASSSSTTAQVMASLANLVALDSLTSRARDLDDTHSLPPPSPCTSPRLPRSSPASPAPSKKANKRNQSSSPIRKHLLNSPLLNRRQRKSKTTESSDDEVVHSGDEVFNGKNYRDLESFQKAQLRQKLKRGKFKDAPECNSTPQSPRRREFVMHNKAPMWNENSQVYQLDFGGRVTQESAKNFQIEFRGKQVMQFGRIDGNAYTLDFQYPFSALQAFAVALANVTQRLK
ncbi:Protein king tubby 1 [Gryllus bimaculatus]|nr:Protein king tubby 1 [Gryllus bimaculatus]